MAQKILVIQHVPHEGLGSFEEEMSKAGFTWDVLLTSNDAVFPSSVTLETYSGMIILGGPMAVFEVGKYPWIRKELLVIGEALRQKKPILGVCLGAQMMAQAAGQGGRVYDGDKTEIGWGPVQLDDWFSKRNPLFFQLDASRPLDVFHWHRNTFDIPTTGYRLAWNENYKNQAFCINGNAVGLQFHVEMTEEMIREWLRPDEAKVQALAAGADPDQILADMPRFLPELRKTAHKLFYGFASLIRENTRRAA